MLLELYTSVGQISRKSFGRNSTKQIFARSGFDIKNKNLRNFSRFFSSKFLNNELVHGLLFFHQRVRERNDDNVSRGQGFQYRYVDEDKARVALAYTYVCGVN